MKYFKLNKIKQLEQWHIWFAWYPVTIGVTKDGDYNKVWMENILRCGIRMCDTGGCYWNFKYKNLIA